MIVVTAKDLTRAELQRLNENALAVLRKDGELESELKHVLASVWHEHQEESATAGVAA